MSDAGHITVRGLRVHGYHGVLAEERRTGQEFVVDAVLEVDTARAAADDDLEKTVDYAAVVERLRDIVAGEPVALIETLAERLAETCLSDPLVRSVELTVHKPHAPVTVAVDDIAVTIVRRRR